MCIMIHEIVLGWFLFTHPLPPYRSCIFTVHSRDIKERQRDRGSGRERVRETDRVTNGPDNEKQKEKFVAREDEIRQLERTKTFARIEKLFVRPR